MYNKRLYSIWNGMKQRCNNPKNQAAKYYHDKGIRVCNEWLIYKNFEKWALVNGYADDLTIDRIDSDKNYEPSNCRWVTLADNTRHAIVTAKKKREKQKIIENAKNKYSLTENEIEILLNFKEVFPQLTEQEKERLLAFGEGMAFVSNRKVRRW